jgi:uncharacterized protein (TIGR02996 family)
MAEQEGLLQAIAEQPDDDRLRLIFADWLEDHGDGPRAEFIRLQIALARLPEDDPHRTALLTRQRGLLLEHESAWVLGLRHLVDSWEFHRGFVEEVTVSNLLGPEQFAELFRWPFVRRVTTGRGWRLFPGLVNCREARVLEGLCFANTELSERQFRDLINYPFLERLVALEASNCGLEARSIRRLAHSPLLGQLHTLVLAGNPVGNEGAAELARSSHVDNLRTLDLSACHLDLDAVVAIASAPRLRGLTTLRLANNSLRDDGCATPLLCPHLAGVVELDLRGNQAGDDFWSALLNDSFPRVLRRLYAPRGEVWQNELVELLSGPRLASLHLLDLSGSSLHAGFFDRDYPAQGPWAPLDLNLGHLADGPAVLVELFAQVPALKRVHRLSLQNVADHEDVFPALISSPHLTGVRALDLGLCMGLAGAMLGELLAAGLTKQLTALDLSHCELGDEDVIALAGHPHIAGLDWLSLAGNYVSSRGARALARSPYLARLRHLDLADNRIDDEGAIALAGTPHLASPVVLNLAQNYLGDEGMSALLQAARLQFARSVTIPGPG